MRSRSRNDEEKQQKRDAILDAAMDVFFSKGFEKASMDGIAKHAKLSRSLIYVYFKDKIDLHMGLCLRAGQTMLRLMKEEVSKHTKGIDQAHGLGEGYYRLYKEEPNLFKLMSMRLGMLEGVQEDQEPTPAQIEMQNLEDQIMELSVSTLETGLADGTISKEKVKIPLQTAMYMRGSLHGLIMLQDATGSRLFDRTGLDREGLIEYSRQLINESISAHIG